MLNKRKFYILIIGILYAIIYYLFSLFAIKYFYTKGLFIRLSDISEANIMWTISVNLILVSFPIVLMIILMNISKMKWSNMGIKLAHPFILFALFSVFIFLFILNGDYSYKGFYIGIYYLLFISATEELIFRCFLFQWFKQVLSTNYSIVISGLFFGLMHSIISISIYNHNPITAILNNLLGFALGGAIFSIMYLRGGTLLIPILVHAILDYSSVFNK